MRQFVTLMACAAAISCSDTPGTMERAADTSAWQSDEPFSVRLEETTCFGSCPAFQVELASDGHITYLGGSYTARPGFYELDLPPADARDLRASLLEAGFLQLRDQYLTTEDGCQSVSTDHPTYIYVLKAAEQTKRIEWDTGCEGSEAEPVLRSLEQQIKKATKVGLFLTPKPDRPFCDLTEDPTDWAETYVLSDGSHEDGRDLGILHLPKASAEWRLTSCDGEPLVSGDAVDTSNGERLLLPARDKPAALAWPGIDTPQGVAIVFNNGSGTQLTVKLLELYEEHRQYAHRGDHCDSPAR